MKSKLVVCIENFEGCCSFNVETVPQAEDCIRKIVMRVEEKLTSSLD